MPELIASGQLPLYDYNDAIIAGAAPVNPSLDTLWLDNSVEPNMMKRWDGLTWEPVGELDPTYSETITAIETTLANMADDGLLDYSDRQKLKEDIALITGATPADAATLPTGATLDGGTVGSYRRIRKAAVSAGMLTSHAAYTALATAYTTLSTFLNARTPKPWDVSLANKATPTPVDKATFRSAWLGYYNAETALADETTATLSSGINTLKNTTIPALENKALSEAEKSAIQTSLNLIVKEKSDLDATSSSYQSNANLIDKTLVSIPKTAYDTSYNALLAAMNDVLDEPTGAAIADAKITAVNTQFTDYGTKLAALRTGFQNAQKAIETKLADDAETAISTALVDYVDKTSYGLDIEKIQNQVDGSIMTHFGANEPTLMNAPASAWSTTVDKDIHLGDLYYDTVSGFAYRFAKNDTVYNWMRIVDTDVTLALRNASTAQDTADAKRRAFYATPTPPYDLGDLWVQGAGGDLMRCSTAKPVGGSYAAEDWTKAVKYTDDAAVNALELGGRNLISPTAVGLTNTTLVSFTKATNTWELSIANGTARGGLVFNVNQSIRIPYGRNYIMSFEVFAPYAATFSWDVNNYPVGASAWTGNDNDNGSLRKNSGTVIAANQWVKCWYSFHNSHASNTGKVDLYDGSNFGINNNTGSTQTIKIRNVKGELGTKPTEWTPTPEDVAQDITDVSTSVTNLQNLTNTTFKDGLIETAEAQAISEHLKVLAKENGDLVNQYNTLNAHTRLLGTAKTNLGTANTNYGASYTALVSSINTAIADDRTSAAEKTDVDTKFTDYATKLKALTKALVDAQASISDQLAKDAANAIQVGGRNLVKETINMLTGASGAMRNYPLAIAYQDFSGKNVTVSCDIEWTNKVDGRRLGFEIALNSAEGIYYIGAWDTPAVSSSGKKRLTNTVTVPVRTYTGLSYSTAYIQMNGTSVKVGNIKVEFGNKATDWSPAPEDAVQTMNSFRESLDASRSIRMGMKIGYSAFATQNATSIYFCGLQRNPETFVEEMVDTDGSIWDFTTKQSIVVAKQVMSLSGLTVGTKGYVIWDGTTSALWFIHYEKIVNAQGVATSERWVKRNVGKVGDNTTFVPSDNTYFLGEVEI